MLKKDRNDLQKLVEKKIFENFSTFAINRQAKGCIFLE